MPRDPFPLASIREEWETFWDFCNLDGALEGASEVQRAEMRRAFYGGAFVCLNHLQTGRALESVAADLIAFADLIKDGKA